MGKTPIPTPAVVADVTQFGAIGDGIADDTQAFKSAISAAQNGAVWIPAGRYKITEPLKINKSNIVLRGAGQSSTTLVFTKSLTEILGTAPSWAGNNGAWSWAGGFIWMEGSELGSKITDITATASRGSRTIQVNSTAGIQVGSIIRIVQNNTDGGLGRHLHAELMDAGSTAPRWLVDFASQVTAISGNQITLERPLRADIRLEWTPQIHTHQPSVQEIGVENLTLSFPNVSYAGHLGEPGYNAVYLDSVANCWARNLTILDADSGILTGPATSAEELGRRSRFCTFDNIRMANQFRPTNGYTGHHGIAFEGPMDMLVSHFSIEKQFVHDLTVDYGSSGNVFSSGSGLNMNFDHHRSVPNENLFTEIDVGAGDTLWTGSRNVDSGIGSDGPPSAARETFWNIRASSAANLPAWPQLNIIGMTKFPTQTNGDTWVEQIDPDELVPVNLYEAQVDRRKNCPSCP